MAEGIETVKLRSTVNETEYYIAQKNIQYTPDMVYSLVSLSKARQSDFKIARDDWKKDPT